MKQREHHSLGEHQEEKAQAAGVLLPKYVNVPLLIFALFLVWVWSRYIQIGVRGGGLLGAIRFEFLLGGLLVVLSVFVLTSLPLEIKRSKNVVFSIVLLFFATIIQVPFAALPVLAQNIFFERVVKFAFLALFMVVFIRSPSALRWFIIVWMVSIFWVTQESVRGLISGNLVWQNQGIMRLHGAVPIYAHPNSLGGVAMGAVPFVVFLWPVWKRWWQRLAMSALLATSLTCVIYSGSRTAYVALIAFLVFWFMRSKSKGRFVAIVLIAAPIVFLAIPDQYIGRFKSITDDEAQGQSREARMEILRDAWVVFSTYPGGVGVGCFPVVRNQMFGRHQDTHNLYYEVATNLGIQGLVVFGFFIWAMMKGFLNAHHAFESQIRELVKSFKRQNQNPELRRARKHAGDLVFLMAVANAGAGFVFVRLVLGLFGMDLYEVYWWFGAGLVISLLEMAKKAKSNIPMTAR